MEPIYWIFGAFAVFLVVFFIVARQLDKKRTAELTQTAMEMGFAYEHDGVPCDATGIIHLFNQGHSRESHHLMRGSAAGAETVLFDYQYTVGSGKNSHQYLQTVAAYRLAASAPVFQLAPEGFWQKVSQKFGLQDIDFDTHPDFSKRYLLRGPDEPSIRAFFNPGLLGYFESLDRTNQWHVETGDGWIVFYVLGKRRKPQEMRSFLDETSQMYSAIKGYVSGGVFGRGA